MSFAPIHVWAMWLMATATVYMSISTGCVGGKPSAPPEETVQPLPEISIPSSCDTSGGFPDSLHIGVPMHSGVAFLGGNYRELISYLSDKIGLPTFVSHVEKYSDITDKLVNGEMTIGLLPPLEYVRAHQKYPCLIPICTMVRNGSTHYTGYLVVRRDSKISDIGDLKGHSLGFVDSTSASGFLYPVLALRRAGIDPEKDPSEIRYFGNHLTLLDAVINGQIEVAASFAGALKLARAQGRDAGSLRVLAITGSIPYDALVVRPGLSVAAIEKIRQIFLDLNSTTQEGRKALAPLFEVNGWLSTTDAFYDPVREVLQVYSAAEDR